MDKQLIAAAAANLTSKQDLLSLLNEIKRDQRSDAGINMPEFYPFTMAHLNYYCNPNHTFHRYKQFKIRKKSGGFRQITAPLNTSFKLMLQAVNEILKALYTPSKYAMGFAENRSVATNAAVHQKQNYVFNLDLQDFFPSIEQARVWKRLQLKPFNFPKSIANILAGLCAMRKQQKNPDGTTTTVYVLPQGAPTSPILTNMICDNLDRRLAGLARRFGLRYTRYADDITFSSMHYVYAKDGEFRIELRRIISEQGFTINADKTRLQKNGARQEVTGIIVNEKVNVAKQYSRNIRNLLYIWDRYGISVARARFIVAYKTDKGATKKGIPDMVNVILGKLMYLKMVKGENDHVYTKLNDKFRTLVTRDFSSDKTNVYGINYIETLPVMQFEKINDTAISIVHKDGKPRYGTFSLAEQTQLASVSKAIKEADETKKDRLSISACRDVNGKHFWHIHYNRKNTKPAPPIVDIDELNYCLEQLIEPRYGK